MPIHYAMMLTCLLYFIRRLPRRARADARHCRVRFANQTYSS